MTKKDKNKKSLPEKLVSIFIKLVLVVAVLCGLFIGALELAERSGAPVKEGIKRYFAESTNTHAEIETLSDVSFFPDISFVIEGLKLTDPENKENVKLQAEKFELSMPFTSILFGQKDIKKLDVSNLTASAGFLTPRKLTVSSMRIEDQDSQSPQVIANGTYADKTSSFTMALQKEGSGHYDLPDEGNVEINVGDLSLSGKIDRSMFETNLKDINFGYGNNRLTGNLNFSGGKTVDVSGNLTFLSSEIRPDVKIREDKVTGSVTFSRLDVKDIDEIQNLVDRTKDLLTSPDSTSDTFFGDTRYQISVSINELTDGETVWGDISFPVDMYLNTLEISSFSGQISQGQVSGDMTYDAAVSPPKMDLLFKIKDLDYSRGGGDLSGQGNVEFKLTSRGITGETLMSNLSGTIGFVGGKGEFNNDLLFTLAGGLLNALLPDFGSSGVSQTVMNCGIADFSVEQGIAKSNVLFFDFQNMTLVGEGSINLADQTIDMSVTPKSKDPEILKFSSTINITGPLFNPNKSISTFSLAKNIGSLFLGTINPALLLFTMSDLGLTSSHPCSKYIEGENSDNEEQ